MAEDDVKVVDFEGVEYTQSEAKALINWMADPARQLLWRYLLARRQSYIDMLDCGGITLDNAEEMVRGSAQCDLIRAVSEIAAVLGEQVKDTRIETS
jgi:hypothetical protein